MSLEWAGEGKGCPDIQLRQSLVKTSSCCSAPLRWLASVLWQRSLMAGLVQKVKVKGKGTVASAENQPAS
jgi:hypothetical protein